MIYINKAYEMFGVDTTKEVKAELDFADRIITQEAMNVLYEVEATVEVLLDETTYESKPQGYEIAKFNNKEEQLNYLINYVRE